MLNNEEYTEIVCKIKDIIMQEKTDCYKLALIIIMLKNYLQKNENTGENIPEIIEETHKEVK